MPLNSYATLGRSGLRVSPFCLGAMTFGEDWGWGATPEDSSKYGYISSQRSNELKIEKYQKIRKTLKEQNEQVIKAEENLSKLSSTRTIDLDTYRHQITSRQEEESILLPH